MWVHSSLHLQLNCVVMKGVNDDEIPDFVALTEKKVSTQDCINSLPTNGTHMRHGLSKSQ